MQIILSLFLLICCWLVEGGHEVVITKFKEVDECERRTKYGDRVYIKYTGSIDETSTTGKPNTVFDSNMSKKSPLEFYIGRGTVIEGLEKGVIDMCVKEKRIIVIPPELGYGSRGFGRSIPKDATLRFLVELVSIGVKPPVNHPYFTSSDDVFSEIDYDENGLLDITEVLEYVAKRRIQGRPRDIFDNEDKNRDGIVTWEEFTGPKQENRQKKIEKIKEEKERDNKRPGVWQDDNVARGQEGQKVESVEVKVGGVNVKLDADEVGWN